MAIVKKRYVSFDRFEFEFEFESELSKFNPHTYTWLYTGFCYASIKLLNRSLLVNSRVFFCMDHIKYVAVLLSIHWRNFQCIQMLHANVQQMDDGMFVQERLSKKHTGLYEYVIR